MSPDPKSNRAGRRSFRNPNPGIVEPELFEGRASIERPSGTRSPRASRSLKLRHPRTYTAKKMYPTEGRGNALLRCCPHTRRGPS